MLIPIAQGLLDVGWDFGPSHVRVHERRIRLDEQSVKRDEPFLQDRSDSVIRLVLPQETYTKENK